MAVTVSLYNQTAELFASGGNVASVDDFKVLLCTAATFDGTDVTMGDVTMTQVANANGYTTDGQSLTNVSVTTVTTNDAKFDADDVVWTASGGSIAASYAILYNASFSGGGRPLAFINFGGTETAGDGTDFKIVWNSAGIFSFTVS